jgi:hypothetical protein
VTMRQQQQRRQRLSWSVHTCLADYTHCSLSSYTEKHIRTNALGIQNALFPSPAGSLSSGVALLMLGYMGLMPAGSVQHHSPTCEYSPVPGVLKSGMPALTLMPAPHMVMMRRALPLQQQHTQHAVGSAQG